MKTLNPTPCTLYPNQVCCESYGRTTNGKTCHKNKECCYNASTQTTTCCDPNECKSCVDGECKDCQERYGQCCKCATKDPNDPNTGCTECRCWDVGEPIDGDITGPNEVCLCQQVQFTSSVWDKDHWHRDCPDIQDANVFDTLTYAWDQTAGSNPQLGTFTSSSDQSFVYWQASPCKGTITINLVVDDKPDDMDIACPGGNSNRDDQQNNFAKLVDVGLPVGCEEAGPHDSSIHWNHTENLNANLTESWGLFTYQHHATFDDDFKYEDCQWKCEISNVQVATDVQVHAPNSNSITSASDVKCADANQAKDDLDDPNLADDVGAPLSKYWMHSAIVAHEYKHRSDWVYYYGDELNKVISYCEAITVAIDCQSADTCGWAKYLNCDEIDQKFEDAWDLAKNRFDDPSTSLDEAEQRAYEVENTIEQPVSDALPAGCTP